MKSIIEEKLNDIVDYIRSIKDTDEKIDLINEIRAKIHNVSPLKNHPVDYVKWEKNNSVDKNDYNPNHVAPPEFKLLNVSIEEDGYTMPIYVNFEDDKYIIIDGFHRRSILNYNKKINNSTFNRIPITLSNKNKSDISSRMASTIRHNRARGSHDLDMMCEIIAELTSIGKTDEWIMKHIGMDKDELLRLKQITGLQTLFENSDFNKAWNPSNE